MAQLTPEQMDEQGKLAQEELNTFIANNDAPDYIWIADWWKRWYLKAGHKRLAWVLMKSVAE
jgi:hypothetical protein